MRRPQALLLDEPFSALDAFTRAKLQDHLAALWSAYKFTLVLVTHDIEEAVFLADRVVALGGRPGEVKMSQGIAAARPRRRGDPALRDVAASIKTAMAAEAAGREDWSI